MGTALSTQRGGDSGEQDAVGALLAKVAQLEGQLGAVIAERDRLQRQVLAQADLAALLEARPAADGSTGPMPATRVPGPRAPSHRVPKEQRWLKVVTAFAPLAFLGRHLVKGSAARKITGVALAAALVPPAAAVGTHVMERAPYQAAAPAPVAVTVPAVRVSAPSLAAASRPRHHHHVSVPVSVPPPATVRPRPSSSPSSSSPSAPQITVPAAFSFGVYVSGTISISNPQDQAVSWTVDCGPDVTAVPSSGVLMPGQQGAQVRLSINAADGASSAACVFTPGSERTLVTWAGPGSPTGTTG